MPKGIFQRPTSEERFWSMVDKVEADKCWNWKGSRQTCNYGQFSVEQKPVLAHRYAFRTCNGEIPTGHVVRHTCDNTGCVNPSHLISGTQKDNMRDKMERGRWRGGRPKKVSLNSGNNSQVCPDTKPIPLEA